MRAVSLTLAVLLAAGPFVVPSGTRAQGPARDGANPGVMTSRAASVSARAPEEPGKGPGPRGAGATMPASSGTPVPVAPLAAVADAPAPHVPPPSLSVIRTDGLQAAAPDRSRTAIEHDGERFELANRSALRNVETDEYVLAGEKIGRWTQLVTVQRLTLPKPCAADRFVGYFQSRVRRENGTSLEVLREGAAASVFHVRFAASDRNAEQEMICLAFVDRQRPSRLNIVQFAIKPAGLAPAVLRARVRSWRERFLQQADALSHAAAP